MMKILLVEDNKEISDNVANYLEKVMEVQPVYSGGEAIEYLKTYNYDVVILDLLIIFNQ